MDKKVNENIKKAVHDLISKGDNISFMKHLQNAVYDKLRDNPQFRQYADELEKYSKK